jgi:hypothetical protein
LLWVLLALLLLALLLLLPRACTPNGIDLKRAIPGLSPPDDAASAPPEQRAELPPGEQPPGGQPPGGAGGMNPPGSEPGTPPGTEPGAPPGAEPPLPSASQPGGPDAPSNEPPKTDPPLPGNEPKQDPPLDPNKEPAKDPKQDPKTDPPVPPPNPKDMKLPDDPKSQQKMDFLEGGWKAGDGLFDRGTGQPLDLGFKFGKDGQGEVTLRRPDGTTCSGKVQGKMNGGKLGIQGNQSIPCSNGSSYGAPRIECQKERGGQTQCYGVNPDGSRYYMGMQKQ